MGKYLTRELTDKQSAFIEAFRRTYSVSESLKISGMDRSNFNRDCSKDTRFAIEFKQLRDNATKLYEFSKLNSLKAISEMIKETRANKEWDLMLKGIKQLALMQEDHLAVQKREEKKTNVNVEAVIDFTKPKEIEENIDYIEI